MKIKNTLLALSTATVVAFAGAGAATAAETTDTTDTTVVTTQDETSSSKDGETTGSSSEDFFGWDENTDGAQKFEDVTGVIGKVFEFFGKIVKIFI